MATAASGERDGKNPGQTDCWTTVAATRRDETDRHRCKERQDRLPIARYATDDAKRKGSETRSRDGEGKGGHPVQRILYSSARDRFIVCCKC